MQLRPTDIILKILKNQSELSFKILKILIQKATRRKYTLYLHQNFKKLIEQISFQRSF
jgi:hypothetical protein